MTRHAAYWQPLIDSGQMVIFGPVLDGTGSWGLGVVEADDEEKLRAFAASDPRPDKPDCPDRDGQATRRLRAARADRRVAEAPVAGLPSPEEQPHRPLIRALNGRAFPNFSRDTRIRVRAARKIAR